MVRGRLASMMLAGAVVLGAARDAHADDLWQPEFRKATIVETSIFVTVGAAAFVLEYTVKEPQTSVTRGGIVFDEGARGSLRASSDKGRARASTISDVGFWGMT